MFSDCFSCLVVSGYQVVLPVHIPYQVQLCSWNVMRSCRMCGTRICGYWSPSRIMAVNININDGDLTCDLYSCVLSLEPELVKQLWIHPASQYHLDQCRWTGCCVLNVLSTSPLHLCEVTNECCDFRHTKEMEGVSFSVSVPCLHSSEDQVSKLVFTHMSQVMGQGTDCVPFKTHYYLWEVCLRAIFCQFDTCCSSLWYILKEIKWQHCCW